MEAIETRELYTFDELSDEAQDKAVEEMWDINIMHEWYNWTREDAADRWQKKYGITFDPKKVYFDFDRAFWIAFDDIWVSDEKALYRALEMSHGEKLAVTRQDICFSFHTSHYGGGRMSTSLDFTDYRPSTAPDLTVDPNQWFSEICQELLYDLRQEYEYLTSKGEIIETIKINEYEFSAEGEF